MALERPSNSASVIDVLDRVLDKGIVTDAWVRVSLVGIDLLTIEARVIVASIESYLHHAESFAELARHPPHQPRNLTRP
jgi:gas vesicle structural protein